jgi:hypothetical protein
MYHPSGASGAIGWGTTSRGGRFGVRFLYRVLGNFQVAYSFCPHSVAWGSIQPLTELSTEEFIWRQRATGAYSWQFCFPGCAECRSKNESSTFFPSSKSPWILQGSCTLLYNLYCSSFVHADFLLAMLMFNSGMNYQVKE